MFSVMINMRYISYYWNVFSVTIVSDVIGLMLSNIYQPYLYSWLSGLVVRH